MNDIYISKVILYEIYVFTYKAHFGFNYFRRLIKVI